jgi:hypothetical protein
VGRRRFISPYLPPDYPVLRRSYSGYEEGKTLRVDSQQSDDAIEFTARAAKPWLPALGPHEMPIEVRLPKDSDLNVETGDGISARISRSPCPVI